MVGAVCGGMPPGGMCWSRRHVLVQGMGYVVEQVLGYMIERFRAWYEDESIPVEVFRAVSARQLSRPLDIHQRVQAVHTFAGMPQAQSLAAANKRVGNILGKLPSEHAFGAIDEALFAEDAERDLAAQIEQQQSATDSDDQSTYSDSDSK